MIRIIVKLFMVAGLMLLVVGVNGGLQTASKETHLGWRAKSESAAAHNGDRSLLERFLMSFRDVVAAEKEPPKSDLQRLLDRRRRDTAPFDLGPDMPIVNQLNR